MELSFVSISNYRSITDAYKLDLSNLTVLLGKNNEGKTNIIKAITLGMDILHNISYYGKRRIIPKQQYDWRDDFPIILQDSKKIKNKCTKIRFDFKLSKQESDDLSRAISSNINEALSIYITIDENNILNVLVPKRGKNAKAISSKIIGISTFICNNFSIQYIPAIRSETEAYNVITDLVEDELATIKDQVYIDSLEYIEKAQQEKLNILSDKVIEPLQAFLPQIKSVNILLSNKYRRNSSIGRRNLVINVDDGVLTNLSNKGDGVKSLATIALLSQLSSNTNRLIIIDEPENHLHPEAIRYISNVVNELSINNQVIVSTHSPLFINRSKVSSNVIVSKGKTVNASKITDVRDVLGVMCSDNLMYSDYVVVVEGQTDKTLFEKLMLEDNLLKQCLKNNIITVRSIGGTNNLQSEIYALQRYCCNYLVVLDGDSIGKSEANNIRQKLSVPNEQIRFIMVSSKKESELEDLYKQDFYSDYLLSHGIDIQNPIFKNKSIKWSNRIKKILEAAGIEFLNEEEDTYKKEISEMIAFPVKDYLSSEGYNLLGSILDKIKADLTQMRLL